MILKIVLLAQLTHNEDIEIEEDMTLYTKCTGVVSNRYLTEWTLEKDLYFATCDFDNLKLRKDERKQLITLAATSDSSEDTVQFKVESISVVPEYPSPI